MKSALPLIALILMIGCAGGRYIYQSGNNIDYVKIAEARGDETAGGLRHPAALKPDQLRAMLRSVNFNKRVLLAEDIEDRQLFGERSIEFLAPYLVEAFGQLGPKEVVVVSFFTQSRKFGVMNDRLTIFRAFVMEDGLHLKFSKIYAKLLGDRTTKGLERSVQGAKTLRVDLETGPGLQRISWDPEEIAFDLKYDFVKGVPPPPEKTAGVKPRVKMGGEAEPPKSVRERLKELDRMKEDELITEKEYEKKRKELLRQL